MKTLYAPLVLTGLLLTSSVLTAQEVSVGRDTIHADTRAIAMQMDAKNAAVLAVLQKLTVCNAKSKFYQPTATSADADGCAASSVTGLVLTPAGVMTIAPMRGRKTVGPQTADLCLLTGVVVGAFENLWGTCTLSKDISGWSLTATASERRSNQGCTATCYNFQ